MSTREPPTRPLPDAWQPTLQMPERRPPPPAIDPWQPTQQTLDARPAARPVAQAWQATQQSPDGWQATQQSPETWQATQQAAGPRTQLLTDREADGAPGFTLGRHVGAHLWEMFVVFDPAQALQMQLERQTHEFVAVHDLGGGEARRWMLALAAEHGWPVHRLVVRSQGFGVALATIEFLELPTADGPPLRLYSTDVDADSRQRQQLARVLLGASRLALVLVGEMPPHALRAAMEALDETMGSAAWRNRNLMVCPLAAAAAVALRASQLGVGTAVEVTTTPPAARGGDAYVHAVQAWNGLRRQWAGVGPVMPELVVPVARPAAPAPAAPASTLAARQPVAPLSMQPMPELRPAAPAGGAAPAQSLLQRYARRCLEVRGMISCCVFELQSQRTLGFAGARPGPAALATQGAAMHVMMTNGARTLGMGAAPPEAAITLADHYLVLRPLPQRPGVLLHAVIDRSATPLAAALQQLEALDTVLREG